MRQGERKRIVHSKEDALSTKEIKMMLSGPKNLTEEFVVKSILFSGMRAGEIAHMRKEWWERHKKIISIPTHQACTCKDCRLRKLSIDIDKKKWKQDFPHDPLAAENLRKAVKDHPDYKAMFAKLLVGRWEPKTYAGIREVPIVYHEFEEIMGEFFEHNEAVNLTRQRIWQIVMGVAKRAGVKNPQRPVYPHCMRATCASLWGLKKVSAGTMCRVFGWDNVSSANPYITTDKERAQKEIVEMAGKKLW